MMSIPRKGPSHFGAVNGVSYLEKRDKYVNYKKAVYSDSDVTDDEKNVYLNHSKNANTPPQVHFLFRKESPNHS